MMKVLKKLDDGTIATEYRLVHKLANSRRHSSYCVCGRAFSEYSISVVEHIETERLILQKELIESEQYKK